MLIAGGVRRVLCFSCWLTSNYFLRDMCVKRFWVSALLAAGLVIGSVYGGGKKRRKVTLAFSSDVPALQLLADVVADGPGSQLRQERAQIEREVAVQLMSLHESMTQLRDELDERSSDAGEGCCTGCVQSEEPLGSAVFLALLRGLCAHRFLDATCFQCRDQAEAPLLHAATDAIGRRIRCERALIKATGDPAASQEASWRVCQLLGELEGNARVMSEARLDVLPVTTQREPAASLAPATIKVKPPAKRRRKKRR